VTTYTRQRLRHSVGWYVFDVAMLAALVIWSGVDGWRGVAVALVWNIAGYVQGLRRSRLGDG
jgi:hypothetical protein